MRAVRLVEARRLELVEIPDPEPVPGEVVVRVVACGICGSDLSCYKNGVFAGRVLGHEASGVVESVGDGLDGWAAGDPVAINPTFPCGECPECVAGETQRCSGALAGNTRHVGAYAERIVVPTSALFRLPSELPVENGCLVEPLAVVLHGFHRARVSRRDESALVIGLGPIGLLSVAALRSNGTRAIAGVDPVEPRRALARDLGATSVFASVEEARDGGVREIPLVVECSGRAPMIQEAANTAAPGGRILLLGVPMTEATIHPMYWVVREYEVVGSVSSGPKDFDASIALLVAHPDVARIITRRVSLAELPAAFEALLSPTRDAKVAVDPRL